MIVQIMFSDHNAVKYKINNKIIKIHIEIYKPHLQLIQYWKQQPNACQQEN